MRHEATMFVTFSLCLVLCACPQSKASSSEEKQAPATPVVADASPAQEDAPVPVQEKAPDQDESPGAALTLRGEQHLADGEYAAALADFESSLQEKSPEHYRNWKGITTAQAGMGNADECHRAILRCLELDPERVPSDIIAMATPFFRDAERQRAGIEFFEKLEVQFPDAWWVHANVGRLAERLGRAELAERAFLRSQQLLDPPPPRPDPHAMMELAQPGPEHAKLATRVGQWETDVSIQMTPGVPPTRTTGTASSQMILGGRFLEVVSKGELMGQDFESRSFMGFDRRNEVYTLIGLDTSGTYWVTAKGKRGEDGIIRMHGEDDDPMGKQVYTFEYQILSEDEHEYRVVFTQLGAQTFDEPFTMVTVRSKRKD